MKKALMILGLIASTAFVPPDDDKEYLKFIEFPKGLCRIKQGDTLCFDPKFIEDDGTLRIEKYHGQKGYLLIVK